LGKLIYRHYPVLHDAGAHSVVIVNMNLRTKVTIKTQEAVQSYKEVF